jgi:hypothetical protein
VRTEEPDVLPSVTVLFGAAPPLPGEASEFWSFMPQPAADMSRRTAQSMDAKILTLMQISSFLLIYI